MACGCPVIASRIPSTVEVAGDIPFYFEPSEPESLRDALDTALSETHNTDRITAGFSRLKNYSWEKTARQTLEIYQQFSH
jgi:glycosyltransferase involved in cell wall biosynthesis